MKKSHKAYKDFRSGLCSLDDVYKVMCQEIVKDTGATRASIWLFSQDGKKIICQLLFDKRTLGFSRDAVLSEKDFPDYFKAIQGNCIVNAADAIHHPATKCFNGAYFYPNSIVSLLDFVILNGTTPFGILCCENCGEIKNWTKKDEDYLSEQAAILSLIHSKVQKRVEETA